jgi:two-component system cell cycle sensor histidine kinase/response regulator CckA
MVQLSANKFEGEKQIFAVENSMHEMSDLLKVIAGDRINYKTNIEKDIAVEMNKIEFNQMMVNLVKNAKLAIIGEGSITINGKKVSMLQGNRFGVTAGDYIKLEIIDSGCGIAEGNLAQIFDPFFTTRRTSGGSGLGLSGVYSILQKYQGAIEVKSEVNVGTTFIVYLKSVNSKMISHSKPASTNQFHEQKINLRALYLEDLKDLREVMAETLGEAGYKLQIFSQPLEAMAYIDSKGLNDIDIILSDVSMPYMSGVDFAEKVWEKYPQMKFVFITGFLDQSVFEKIGTQASKFIVLGKPTSIDEINRAVFSLLGRSISLKAA